MTGALFNLEAFNLEKRDIHVWPVLTVAPDFVVASCESLLAQVERERAARFHFDNLRRSFILTRASLRILLGSYLNRDPSDIRFEQGPNGKPYLAPPEVLEFNASHSGGLALFAFTKGCELGVDVEHIRHLPDMLEIADGFFCAGEADELRSLPADQRERAFFNCWTRKEAYVKAIGQGLSAPLNGFRVSIRPTDPARFIHTESGQPGCSDSAAPHWVLHSFELLPDYAAALACPDASRPVSVFPLVQPPELLGYLSRNCLEF